MEKTIEKIVSLLRSSDDVNRELAFALAKGQNIDLIKTLNEDYQEFFKWFDVPLNLNAKQQIFDLYEKIDELSGEWNFFEKEIDFIPPAITHFPEITSLNFQNNNIETLPLELFELKSLNTFYVSGNLLKEIPDEIKNLTELENFAFSLKENNISENVWTLPNVNWLSISNSPLKKLPSLKELKNLDSLYIENCQLEEIPICSEKLDWLDVSNNNLKNIPEFLRKLTNLTWLDLSGNNLLELPSWIGELNKLSVVVFKNNKLSNLPEGISDLKKLSELSLKNNQLKTLPNNLLQKSSFYGMDLHNNQIDLMSLSDEFWKVEKDYLGISFFNNQITEIPKAIKKATLKSLCFRKNLLTTLPDELFEMKCASLDFFDNQLTTISDKIMNLKALKELDLGKNKLKEIPITIFELKELEKLSLEYNPFTQLPSGYIQKLTMLKKVFFDQYGYNLLNKEDQKYLENSTIEVTIYENEK